METLATDKPDYSPGETVHISGVGFGAVCDVELRITRPDGVVESVPATTDLAGGVAADYVLPPPPGVIGDYTLDAVGLGGQVLASAVFGDGIITLVGSTSAQNGSASPPSGSLTISKPSGVVEGDFLIAQITLNGGSNTTVTAHPGSSTPADPSDDWTLLRRENNGTTVGQAAYYRFAGPTATEPASYTWTVSNTTAPRMAGGIIAYRGVDQASPVRNSTSNTCSGTSSCSANNVATAVNDRVVLYYGVSGEFNSIGDPSGSPNANMRYDRQNNGGGPTAAADDFTANDPTSDNRSASSGSNTNWITHTVALRPDNVAPSVTITKAAGQPDPTTEDDIDFTATFSEPVTGFTASDVTTGGTSGGTKTAVVTGGPSVYNVAVSGMTSSGTVTASIPAGVATDGAANGNTASNTATVTYNQPTSPITLRGFATAENGSPSSSTGSLTINKPSGSAQGDFLIAQITFNGGASTTFTAAPGSATPLDTSDDWTLLRRENTGPNSIGQAVYYHFAGASEPASYTWTVTSSAPRMTGGIIAYTGVDSSSPVRSSGANTTCTGASSCTAPSVVTVAGDRVIAYFGLDDQGAISQPFGTTEVYERQSANGGGPTSSADHFAAGGTSSGTKTATTGEGSAWTTHTVALRPVSDNDGDGVPNNTDNCPNVSNSDQTNTDGDAQGDACDPDDDNDGVADAADNCQLTANSDQTNTDGDAQGDACDPDDDNDGVADAADNCQLTANPGQTNTDGDAQGDACDPDDDNDGVADATDNCQLTSNSDQTNTDGDGQGDACDPDDDNDNVPDTTDNCRVDANSDQTNTDGDAQGDACDSDDDNDGVADAADNCQLTPNSGQEDNDADGKGDVCDPDDDNDAVEDANDNCPTTANADQTDSDGDGLGDVCDPDRDGDGVANGTDNCADTPNPDQKNNDGDAQGDVCDPDDDNDTVADAGDNCQFDANTDQKNNDGDTQGDVCDPDDDNDTVADATDNCQFTSNPGQEDNDSDGNGDVCDPDDDNDGVLDDADNCQFTANPGQADADGDGIGDVCDPDRDGDGVANGADNCPDTANPGQEDSDFDGIGDACDTAFR
ncbi:MAG TPA: thrombospondin type 3 repeat-containing protein, partial [Actinomycetota bacterium]|nr:thrombospondin type 3 repeat-containing protein [Actinomycetota bacterium]